MLKINVKKLKEESGTNHVGLDVEDFHKIPNKISEIENFAKKSPKVIQKITPSTNPPQKLSAKQLVKSKGK